MHEDPTRQLAAYVSFDPAVDREAMGEAYDLHFGVYGGADVVRAGTRDPSLMRVRAGMRTSAFHLRPLTLEERFDCASVASIEHRITRALGYALVRAELHAPLSHTATVLFARDTSPGFTLEMLGQVMGYVGVEALYEIGAVAWSRSWLGPFGVRFAPLLVTSAERAWMLLQLRADSLARQRSDTQTSAPASPSQPEASERSGVPGGATAPENSTAPPGLAPPPTG